MNILFLLGGFPGFVLGVWASLMPLSERRWSLLALFGVGGSLGMALGFAGVTALVAWLAPMYAAGWMLALLTAIFYALLGLFIGRAAAWLAGRGFRRLRLHRSLFALAFGVLMGLMTGTMFAAVTVGSGALKQLLELTVPASE